MTSHFFEELFLGGNFNWSGLAGATLGPSFLLPELEAELLSHFKFSTVE